MIKNTGLLWYNIVFIFWLCIVTPLYLICDVLVSVLMKNDAKLASNLDYKNLTYLTAAVQKLAFLWSYATEALLKILKIYMYF